MGEKGNEVLLMMPVIEEKKEKQFFPSGGNIFTGATMPVTMEQVKELIKGFTDYNLDTIELHVTGVAETDGITKLFVGLSGEAGVKLVLNKNK